MFISLLNMTHYLLFSPVTLSLTGGLFLDCRPIKVLSLEGQMPDSVLWCLWESPKKSPARLICVPYCFCKPCVFSQCRRTGLVTPQNIYCGLERCCTYGRAGISSCFLMVVPRVNIWAHLIPGIPSLRCGWHRASLPFYGMSFKLLRGCEYPNLTMC